MAPVTEEIRPPWKGPTFRHLRPEYRSGLICAEAVNADANMLETTTARYAVRETRVLMPLVRILTVIEAVYNGAEKGILSVVDGQGSLELKSQCTSASRC